MKLCYQEYHPKPYNTNVLLRSRFQDPIDIICQVPFLEISYLAQASGALRIYTLVDLKALEDEKKKFDKRKIHGLEASLGCLCREKHKVDHL